MLLVFDLLSTKSYTGSDARKSFHLELLKIQLTLKQIESAPKAFHIMCLLLIPFTHLKNCLVGSKQEKDRDTQSVAVRGLGGGGGGPADGKRRGKGKT